MDAWQRKAQSPLLSSARGTINSVHNAAPISRCGVPFYPWVSLPTCAFPNAFTNTCPNYLNFCIQVASAKSLKTWRKKETSLSVYILSLCASFHTLLCCQYECKLYRSTTFLFVLTGLELNANSIKYIFKKTILNVLLEHELWRLPLDWPWARPSGTHMAYRGIRGKNPEVHSERSASINYA